MQNVTQVLIETVVRRTLKDIQDSPRRSSRNLVDMALHFSEGRFQQYFFATAQRMLQNEQSSYYALIQDVTAHVDTERLVRFGMNLGYHGCTVGAKRIRELEKSCGYNIPWTVSLHLDGRGFHDLPECYNSVLSQGENMGIYVWQIFCTEQPELVLPLAGGHMDSAFILYCPPEEITDSFLEAAEGINNLMLAIRYDEEETARACDLAREWGMPYSIYDRYSEAGLDAIRSGELFRCTEQLHPIFTALLAEPDCPEAVRRAVYECVERGRNEQKYETIPWEAVLDSCYVDGIISGDACTAGFGPDGQMYVQYERMEGARFNLFQNELKEIFRLAFPKYPTSEAANG